MGVVYVSLIMFDKLPEPMRRDNVTKAGSAVLAASGATALTAGIIAAPRTTLGLAALAGGILATGNRTQLHEWYEKQRASKKSVVVDEDATEATA
jgi:hypothetical protein